VLRLVAALLFKSKAATSRSTPRVRSLFPVHSCANRYNSEDDFPDFEMDEQLRLLRFISEQTISKVELGNKHPHLILTLESGQIFLINGIHYGYECWQAGISPNPEESCLIVACPGGNLAIWPDRARK